MSDLLCRRFRDRIQARSRSGSRRRHESVPIEPVPADSIRVIGIQHGVIPNATSLNPRLPTDRPLVRVTLVLGHDRLHRTRPIDPTERERLLALCPGLPQHGCGDRGGILDLLSPLEARADSAAEERPGGNGISTAHLIEHVALELAGLAEGGTACAGATCAHRNRSDRFDILLDSRDPALGRAATLLAIAAVRDVSGPDDRTVIHRRCAELLAVLRDPGPSITVPEDVAAHCDWTLTAAQEALEELVRLGYLEPIRAALTFSSVTSTLFRRIPA